MLGDIQKDTQISSYQPNDEILKLTTNVRKDYAIGTNILQKSFPEFNNYSVIERMNKDQKTFQSLVDESDYNPEEAWKWKGTRSLARKKAFAMHAHLTSSYVVPSVFPQNSSQEDDVAMAEAMGDIVEWETINSNYRSSFLLTAMGMLVNPAVFLQADYLEAFQKIKEKKDKGYSKIEILDEVLSGLNCNVWSADQVLITNAYEQNIQRQRAIIKTRYVEYSESEAKYKDHDNWTYLHPGRQTIYDDASGLFYDVADEDHPYLVKEITWENRRQDGEVCFLGGIYFGDSDIEGNAIKHRDNNNAPKYDIVPFGYHRINEHFFYYASLMFEVGWDDRLIDAMYQTVMNREFIDLEQPIMISGIDKIDTSVIFPGGVFSTTNENARIQPIVPPKTTNPYNALKAIEDSMSEAALSEMQQGQLPEASQKATASVITERNAKILLSGVAKTLAESVSQLGGLLVDIGLNHLTTAQYDEITNKVKYRDFVLQDQMVNGKKVNKKIRFDEALVGRNMTESEKTQYGMKLLEEIGYPNNKQAIYVLNPHLFSKLKYLIRIEADEMLPKNKEFDKMIIERLYSLLRQDPLIDPETLVRKLLYASFPQDVENLMSKQQAQQMVGQVMGQQGQQKQLAGMPNMAGVGM